MSGALLGVIALALVVASVWVWMNLLLVKRGRREVQETHSQPTGSASETGSPVSTETFAPAVEQSVPPSPDAGRPLPPSLESVEVLDVSDAKRGVFDAPKRPFVLQAGVVPQFAESDWLQTFHQLTSDPRVLGWVAFWHESLGAADRDYEAGFVEALRQYQRTVEKLRKEVGLSHVVETTVCGNEGKVWFITSREDAWFALFVERQADVEDISRALLADV